MPRGHCPRDPALAARGRAQTATEADTSATSLETLINLVGSGYGLTLVPAAAVRGAWMTDLEVVVRLVYRKGNPRNAVLETVAGTICQTAPNTDTQLE